MLAVYQLSVGYQKKVVLDNLSFELQKGELYALVGVNGSGKSTLLRTLAGLQMPLLGGVVINGESIKSMSAQKLSRTVSVVLSEKINFGWLTVTDFLCLRRAPYTNFYGKLTETDKKAVANALELCNISAFAHHKVAALSDGEKQKVLVASALVQDTPIILLDEPTAFLDIGTKTEYLLLLKKIANEHQKLVLISTHDIAPAFRLADKIMLIDNTSKLHVNLPDELLKNNHLESVFARPSLFFDVQTFTFLPNIIP
jgi:iron complex transport system ATP-binding protein